MQHGLLHAECLEADHIQMSYSISSMVAMFLYYGLLMVLAVFSMRISAFVLVCGRTLVELGLFLLAISLVILASAASISALKHNSEAFKGIHVGALALFKMLLQMYGGADFQPIHGDNASDDIQKSWVS